MNSVEISPSEPLLSREVGGRYAFDERYRCVLWTFVIHFHHPTSIGAVAVEVVRYAIDFSSENGILAPAIVGFPPHAHELVARSCVAIEAHLLTHAAVPSLTRSFTICNDNVSRRVISLTQMAIARSGGAVRSSGVVPPAKAGSCSGHGVMVACGGAERSTVVKAGRRRGSIRRGPRAAPAKIAQTHEIGTLTGVKSPPCCTFTLYKAT